MSDLILRRASESLTGAEGPDDIGVDGLAIGRIFKAITSPVGTPWLWALNYGDHEDSTPPHGYEATRFREELAEDLSF
jgi:hypothetical protein